MPGNWSNYFTGSAVKPSQVSYEALTISADTALYWPTESLEGVPYVASQIDVTASAAGLSVAMPDATEGATGQACVITNIGSNSFTLTDTGGNQIAVLATTQSWLITLTGNATATGTWRALQMASTTSAATASSLAGNGLQAAGALLQTEMAPQYLTANTTITASYRAAAIVWNTNASGTLTLDTITNLTPGWWASFKNDGTGTLTIATSASETIDGAATVTVPAATSAVIVCSSTGFTALGTIPLPISVADGGTGAGDPTTAIQNLGATALGLSLFTAVSSTQVLAALGIQQYPLTQSTISTNQSLTAGSSMTAFVCTAALTITLPATSTLTTQFNFIVYAQGGAVTIAPNIADKINGGTAGTSFVIPKGLSFHFTTDAAGNWWPLYWQAGGPLTVPGYFALGSGHIVQYGTAALSGTPLEAAITFPIPFPNAALICLCTSSDGGTTAHYISVLATSLSKTGVTLLGESGAANAFWLAIGY